MEEGPFRASRPTARTAASRPEPAYRQPEQPQTAKVEPTPVERPTTSRASEKKKLATPKGFRLPLIIIAVVLLGVIGWFVWSNANKSASSAIDTGKYQAVFFTNGQVYFGKLSPLNGGYMRLTDIYYLQTQSKDGSEANPQETSTDQSNVQLIKLGEEIHGPEDEMILSTDQLLFYENLKDGGKVAQSIESYKKSH